jgi:hypothetical protein
LSGFIFFFLLLGSMFFALVLQHFIGPIQPWGIRVLLMPVVMFYGALAMPLGGTLALAFAGGLMWDALCTQQMDSGVEIALGWSILLYAVLGTVMSGFRPWFHRGRWEVHCLLTGLFCAVIVSAEFIMISIRRQPVTFVFDSSLGWRIGGAGLIAALLAPPFFFFFNYLAALVGYDPSRSERDREP